MWALPAHVRILPLTINAEVLIEDHYIEPYLALPAQIQILLALSGHYNIFFPLFCRDKCNFYFHKIIYMHMPARAGVVIGHD